MTRMTRMTKIRAQRYTNVIGRMFLVKTPTSSLQNLRPCRTTSNSHKNVRFCDENCHQKCSVNEVQKRRPTVGRMFFFVKSPTSSAERPLDASNSHKNFVFLAMRIISQEKFDDLQNSSCRFVVVLFFLDFPRFSLQHRRLGATDSIEYTITPSQSRV